jgi:hypothetical protein
MRAILEAIGSALTGLVVGYFLFAKVNGEYISLELYLRILFNQPPQGLFSRVVFWSGFFEEIRRNAWICAGVGAVIGFIAGAIQDLNRPVESLRHRPSEVQELRVPCPQCAELIRPAAKTCRFCGFAIPLPSAAPKIYQGGREVGVATGVIAYNDSIIQFARLENTGALNQAEVFQFQNHSLRIQQIGSAVGMTLEDVVCGKVR